MTNKYYNYSDPRFIFWKSGTFYIISILIIYIGINLERVEGTYVSN